MLNLVSPPRRRPQIQSSSMQQSRKMCLPNRTSSAMLWPPRSPMAIAKSLSTTTTMTSSTNTIRRLINNIKIVVTLSLILVPNFAYSSSPYRKIPNPKYLKPEGTDLEIPCITEQMNVSCFWLKNGDIQTSNQQPNKYSFASQAPNGDCSLTIYNLEYPMDNSRWECQPISRGPPISKPWPQTNVTVLVKPSAPIINYDNLTNSPISDQLTNISCRSTNGHPVPRLEWYLDDVNITQYSNESVEDRTVVSTLSYTFKKKDNGSKLTCLVAHQTGHQSTVQTLNVQYKPSVSVKEKMYTVYEGKDLEIECHVEANPMARIYWKPTENQLNPKQYDVENNKIKFRNISHTLDGKTFQCSAENSVGRSLTETVNLNVLFPPQLLDTKYPRHNITVGEDIRLECHFSGNPKPKIRWSFTDAVSNNLYHPEPSKDNPEVLIIKNATYLNEGAYYCQGINYNLILNKENVVPSTKFSVNIVGKPLFINSKKTVIGYRGLDTKIEQSFCSDPRPDKVFWLYGSSRIDVDPAVGNQNEEILEQFIDSFHIKTGRLIKIDSLSPNPTCFRVSLMVTNTDTEDIRDYVLVVHNKYGKAEGIVTLQVNSPLSIAAVIAFALIILIIVLAITIGIVLLRRRSSDNRPLDPEIEEKSEVQVPNNDSYDGVQKKKNGH